MLSSRIPAPLPRVTESLAAYESWTSGNKHATSAPPPITVATKKGGKAMNNQTVLSMAQAGLTDENLILAIDDASDVAFDTTPDALITLAKAGVSRNVIAHMQKRAKKQ